MTCGTRNQISPATLAAFERMRVQLAREKAARGRDPATLEPATLAAFERIRARLAIEEIEALSVEVSGQLLEVETLIAWREVMATLATLDVFTWWPSRGRAVPS